MRTGIDAIILLWVFLLGCTNSSLDKTPSPVIALSEEVAINNQGQILPVSARAIVGNETIDLEVAVTPEQTSLGLMYRTSLSDRRGMLFIFNRARYLKFWMKNVKIPLDMIFMREDKIEAIAANVPPCTTSNCPSYGPPTLIDRVIELRGGRAAELGLKVGDRIEIEFLNE